VTLQKRVCCGFEESASPPNMRVASAKVKEKWPIQVKSKGLLQTWREAR